MIIFDQLRLSDDGQKLYINIHVNGADYFKNIYLDCIKIMTAEKVSETSPELPTEDCIYTHTFEGNQKAADMVLTATDFSYPWEKEVGKQTFKKADMGKTLFFVYVVCKGSVGMCTPCRLDELTTLGVTFDEKLLYQRVMDYTKALADDCAIPVGFTDFILLWNAFKAAVETEHYIPAIRFWRMLFDMDYNGYLTADNTIKCNCHG